MNSSSEAEEYSNEVDQIPEKVKSPRGPIPDSGRVPDEPAELGRFNSGTMERLD